MRLFEALWLSACFTALFATDEMIGNKPVEEDDWHSLPVNKMTKLLKMADETSSTEEKKSKTTKWKEVAEGPSFWKKELRKIELDLGLKPTELRMLEGSSVTLKCPQVELSHDDDDPNAPSPFGWMRNSKYIEEDSVDMRRLKFISPFVLRIYPATTKESGRYQCISDDNMIGQVSLEVLTIKQALQEGLLTMMLMVAATFPAYIILSFASNPKVTVVKELLYDVDSEDEHGKDENMDMRVEQLVSVLKVQCESGRGQLSV